MKPIWQTIEQFHMLKQGDRVLLGVSGGPDSIALLHLLDRCRERYDIQLFVVHVNHQLRPEAETEAAYVQDVCRQMEIPFRLFIKNVAAYAKQHGMSLEQAGHAVRYDCFEEAAIAWQINKLALGHHRDDRAESLLLHLVQGCGFDGLTAMPPVDVWAMDLPDCWIIRPLAQVGKQQLLQYCEEHQLQYFVDSTNLEPGCLRNQIRLELLPQLRQYNPQITDGLLRLQDSCAADVDYLEQCTEALWRQYGKIEENCVTFPANILRKQHLALQRRLMRCMYGKQIGSTVDLNFRQIEQMRHIALQTDGSQQIHLADGAVFSRQYDRLIVMRQQNASNCHPSDRTAVSSGAYPYTWDMQQPLEVREWNCVLESEEGHTSFMYALERVEAKNCLDILVDMDRLTVPLLVRSRLPGDRLTMPYGHKKLKEFFIDKKIPAELRDRIPVVQSGEKIIWIPGYYVAECVKITGETERICRLSCKPLIFS